MNINKIIQSKAIIVIIIAIFELAFLVGAFNLGVRVGYHKARFSYAWGEYYDRNFGGPRRGIFGVSEGPDFRGPAFEGPAFMNAHGTFGSIIKIDGDTVVSKGTDNMEKIILISNETQINKFKGTLRKEDLKVNDKIIVIGDPNEQGQIIAKFIRVMP
jgi:hypothetical protein